MQVNLNINITEVQDYVFFQCTKPFSIYPKGGRAGMTHGAAICLIVKMLENPGHRVLWGDVQKGNTDRYYEQFFKPVLEQLPKGCYRFHKGINRVTIGKSFLDFRFMQNPASWEGQGYDTIFINEAGIVLKHPYIWNQVILKSMLDAGDKARCIISGVPKGKNTHFADLIKMAIEMVKAGDQRWDFRAITTYDNPHIPRHLIDQMVKDNPEVSRQEVFGEVLGKDDSPFSVFPADWVTLSMQAHTEYLAANPGIAVSSPTRSAIDPSLGGDECVFGWLHSGIWVAPLAAFTGDQVNDGEKIKNKFLGLQYSKAGGEDKGKLIPVHIDFPGIGESIHTQVKKVVKTCHKMQPLTAVYKKSSDGSWVIKDSKTWWAWSLRERLDPAHPQRIMLPHDPVLQEQLSSYRYKVLTGNIIRLETKDEQKVLLSGKSPDRADCVIYLCAPVAYSSGVHVVSV
jgi:hypothetical protein